MAVIPEQDGFVDLAVKGDGDLLVALADRGRFELGNAVLEIGAAIAPEVGGFGGPVRERAHQYSGPDGQ